MTRNQRFQFGNAYILTDVKEGVFNGEPAIYVGKKDSDMERPTICAVCGQPLGAIDYHSFFLRFPDGKNRDMMIGNGCIKNRINETEINIREESFKDTWKRVVSEFPYCGSWYGTFLHHSIAKPYVKNKEAAEKWDESILELPGVKYIMKIIDELRNEGWSLDAEKSLKCGNVDLLAIHPDKGTLVFDWKSDLSFINIEEYKNQIVNYMSELNKTGFNNISGYIVWVRNESKEHIPFRNKTQLTEEQSEKSDKENSPIRCTLNIEMNGGEGIYKKMTKLSHKKAYGDEVSFFIKTDGLYKSGYELQSFDASPYREGERPQAFGKSEIEDGFYVNFICSKKRRSFNLTANWKRTGPLRCTLEIQQKSEFGTIVFYVTDWSKIDENFKEYVEFDVSEINERLHNEIIEHASLICYKENTDFKTEWKFEDLQNGMKIRIPCIDDCTEFTIEIKTKMITNENNKQKKITSCNQISEVPKIGEKENENTITTDFSNNVQLNSSLKNPNMNNLFENNYSKFSNLSYDNAKYHFTTGRTYQSGNRYYRIFKRTGSDRYNAAGKVLVAEVDSNGQEISKLEWRHVYNTPRKKEYIFALRNHKWKIYADNVLAENTVDMIIN